MRKFILVVFVFFIFSSCSTSKRDILVFDRDDNNNYVESLAFNGIYILSSYAYYNATNAWSGASLEDVTISNITFSLRQSGDVYLKVCYPKEDKTIFETNLYGYSALFTIPEFTYNYTNSLWVTFKEDNQNGRVMLHEEW